MGAVSGVVPTGERGVLWVPDRSAFSAWRLIVDHYNHVHRHTGIGLHAPASVHYGTADEIRAQRAVTLDAAYGANPARFRHRRPSPPKLPTIALGKCGTCATSFRT